MLAFLDPPEIILIVVVVLVLFGGSQLPKLAKNLGKAQQEFKTGLAGRAEGRRSGAIPRPPGGASSTGRRSHHLIHVHRRTSRRS
jgi:sec-independent protein translocase protein TatA